MAGDREQSGDRDRADGAGGEIGAVSYEEVERQIAHNLGLDAEPLRRFMDDAWTDYLAF